jgi:aspartate carbamoyltransferase regulatory subunit
MLDFVFNIKNFNWAKRGKFVSDKLVFVPISLSKLRQVCIFGFEEVADVAKQYRRDFLRIPSKLLKNNESVVVNMMQPVSTVPIIASSNPVLQSDL